MTPDERKACDAAFARTADDPRIQAVNRHMDHLMSRAGKYYTLDENNKPVQQTSMRDWCWWKATYHERCVVAQERVGKLEVSTVFLGSDGERTGLLWETIIFDADCEAYYGDKYRTFEEAKEGHEKAKIEAALFSLGCAVCHRVAPLRDGECPDCCH